MRRSLIRAIMKFRSEFSHLNLFRFPSNFLKLTLGVMNSQYRLFVRLPLWVCLGLLCFMGTFSKRGLLDWRRMIEQNDKLEQKISEMAQQRVFIERQIESFKSSKDEQERVVRQVLGYIKPHETVIEFQ